MIKQKRNKTKIVATLGPASSDEEIIEQLVSAGATMFRLNTSHNTAEEHAKTIEKIRAIEKKLKIFIPIMVDLQGPKIRVGNLIEPIPLEVGKELVLEYGLEQTDQNIVPVDYKGIADDVHEGECILLDDGKIKIQVTKKEGTKVYVKVLHGELLKPRKGINVPGGTGSVSAITEKDVGFIKFAVEHNADYLALSFVRDKDDVLLAKKYISHFGADIPVISKIEKPEAVDNIEEILDASDAVMVARGDLGIELSPEKVPMVQKQIIETAFNYRKTCIVATQMLESMIEEPIPTRAEASDVANAILDGADAVMLSGETAMGKHPVEAVKMMAEIARDVEASQFCCYNIDLEMKEDYEPTPQAIASAAVKMADYLGAKAILAFTHTGYTTKLLSKLRPKVPVIAVSDMGKTCRRLNLYWDIHPTLKNWDVDLTDNLLKKIDKLLLEKTSFQKDDRVIIIGSIPKLITGRTNFVRVHRMCAFQ